MIELGASKVVVVEEEPTVRGIPSVATSVTGAVGTAERGPIGVPVLCRSLDDYLGRFGGFSPSASLSVAALGFFENGGATLWCVRTVHYADVTDSATAAAVVATGTLLAADGRETLRVEGRDPGAYGNRIEIEVRTVPSGAPGGFELVVVDDGRVVERFPELTLESEAGRYAPRVVNDERRGSRLVRVRDLGLGAVVPPVAQTVNLSGGDDGLVGLSDADFVGSPVGRTGLNALDTVQELSLLIVPGGATPAIHAAMLRYCEVDRDGTAFAILDPPEDQSAADMVTYVETTAGLLNLSEYGALYWPRLKVLNPHRSAFGPSETAVVPPSGIIAGVCARTDAARPGGVYESPAGIDNGRMLGVLGFETDECLEERKRDLVYPKRINPLTTGSGLPRFIDGSRTLKSDGNFPFVGERRGVIFIKRSLKLGLQFARHRANNEKLRAEVRRAITSFLRVQMTNGAFRSREPDKAFFVDLSNNTAADVFAGRLNVRVGLATNKPAEFIIVSITQDTRALEAEIAGEL